MIITGAVRRRRRNKKSGAIPPFWIDRFPQADNTTLNLAETGNPWLFTPGSQFKVSGNKGYLSVGGGTNYAFSYTNAGYGNGTYEADIKQGDANAAAGPIFRVTDGLNGIMVYAYVGNCAIWTVAAGNVVSNLANFTPAIVDGQVVHWEIVLNGLNITIKADGVTLGTIVLAGQDAIDYGPTKTNVGFIIRDIAQGNTAINADNLEFTP